MRLIPCLAVFAVAAQVTRRTVLLHGPGAVRRVLWRPDGVFELDLAGGQKDRARLGPGGLALGACVWLDLRGRRRYDLFVTRAGVGAHNFAALRRRLRWPGGAEGPPAAGTAMG